jgi:Integrase core domain
MQITACDAATSYGLADLLPAHDAAAAATFLREFVVPHFQRAGWPVRRVLTDGGPEFTGTFDVACRALGLRHTRTKPRHAWTNGFVERLQGTILQELWRVAFRRRYFTTRAALQRALDGFMRYYNTERPHQGHRLRGRPPAALVGGRRSELFTTTRGRRQCQHRSESGHTRKAHIVASIKSMICVGVVSMPCRVMRKVVGV